MTECPCQAGVPAITEVACADASEHSAKHCCSHCGSYSFVVQLSSGSQVIATRDVTNFEGNCFIPKGRLLRITAFLELPPSGTGFLFSGYLAAGAFRPEGFAALWDIEKIIALNEAS